MSGLTTTRDGGILRVTLDRPDVRNAFDEGVIAALTECARNATKDQTLRAMVLAGRGKSFCAGADLAWMAKAIAYSRNENLRDAEDLARMFEAIDVIPVPVIARVQGAALGGGTGLLAVSDIVIAADNAVFGFTEAKLGIIPAVISPYVLRKIGPSAARELFLTGARFSAARAREIGLVNTLVPEAELDVAVDTCLTELSSSGPAAMAAAKALIREITGRRPDEVIGVTTGRIADQRVSPEGQEGMRAFLEKRKPGWSS